MRTATASSLGPVWNLLANTSEETRAKGRAFYKMVRERGFGVSAPKRGKFLSHGYRMLLV